MHLLWGTHLVVGLPNDSLPRPGCHRRASLRSASSTKPRGCAGRRRPTALVNDVAGFHSESPLFIAWAQQSGSAVIPQVSIYSRTL